MTRNDSAPTDLAEGAILAEKYELLRPIGEGGMSTVWLASNSVLAIEVAVKFIKTELGERGAERLLNEAKTAARLRHPSILEIHDYGQADDGSPFVVMERLEGRSLGEMLSDKGRLNAIEAVELLLPIADALAYAHAQGVVHRDVKPDNVFIAETLAGVRPKILDFGIAKSTVSDRRLTCRGEVLGSPEYMSPEQARGEEVDHRTDIWSFCAMLYETITGNLPFAGRNYNATLLAILEQDVVPSTELIAGDAGLWKILQRGLDKRLSERYASMHDLGRDLATWLLSHGISEDACHTALRSRWLRDSYHPDSEPPPSSSGSVLPMTRSVLVRATTVQQRRIRARDVVAWSMPVLALLVGMDFNPMIGDRVKESPTAAVAGAVLSGPQTASTSSTLPEPEVARPRAPVMNSAIVPPAIKASPQTSKKVARRVKRPTWPLPANPKAAAPAPSTTAAKVPAAGPTARAQLRSLLKNPYEGLKNPYE